MAMRRDRLPAPDLSPATIAVLLRGWSAEAPEPSEHGFGSGMLELFDPNNEGFIRLWTEHRAYLLTVAERWGWAPDRLGPDGVLRYHAEHLAAGYGQ